MHRLIRNYILIFNLWILIAYLIVSFSNKRFVFKSSLHWEKNYYFFRLFRIKIRKNNIKII